MNLRFNAPGDLTFSNLLQLTDNIAYSFRSFPRLSLVAYCSDTGGNLRKPGETCGSIFCFFLSVQGRRRGEASPPSKLLHVIECSLVWRIEINIRTAALSDAGLIAQYNARLALETEQRQLDAERVLAGVTALLNHPTKGTYYLAQCARDGRKAIAGQLLITYEWSDWRNGDFWWIQSVYVDKEFRNHGVFRALFHHVHGLAKAREDVCGLRLYMDAENATARRAYERLGLESTDYQVFEMDFVL